MKKRVLSGDGSAWQDLYDSSFDTLWRGLAAGHPWWERQELEEVVQEVWLVAVRRMHAFDPRQGAFKSWLRGIAENVLREHQRRRWRRLSREQGIHAARIEAPGEVAPLLELRELLALSWRELPAHYQQVLGDKYVRELSVEEIASQQRSTPKRVESLLSRARAAFRQVYERQTGST